MQKESKILFGNSKHWRVLKCKELTCEISVNNYLFAEGDYVILSSIYGFEVKEIYELSDDENNFSESILNHQDLADGTFVVFDFKYNQNIYFRISLSQSVPIPLISRNIGVYIDKEDEICYKEFITHCDSYKESIKALKTAFNPKFFLQITPKPEYKILHLLLLSFFQQHICSSLELIQCNSDEAKERISGDLEFMENIETILYKFSTLKEISISSFVVAFLVTFRITKESNSIFASALKKRETGSKNACAFLETKYRLDRPALISMRN